MANPDDVKLMRSGSQAIREWKRKNPKARLDLSGEKIADLDLGECDLSDATMSSVFLYCCWFKHISLVRCDLSGALLQYSQIAADFSDASLVDVDVGQSVIYESDFSHAHLTKGHLILTILFKCNLSGMNMANSSVQASHFYDSRLEELDLTNVLLEHATFSGCDLSKCKGLSTVIHKTQTNIDMGTVTKSFIGAGGCFDPELRAFFVNAGIQKEFLDAIPRILAKIKYCSCFVCYGEPDKPFAERLTEDLKTHGVSCWVYSLDATPGKTIWSEIWEKMEESEKMIILCSAQSLVRDGVKKEIEKQKDEDPDRMIPISLDRIWTALGFIVQKATMSSKPF